MLEFKNGVRLATEQENEAISLSLSGDAKLFDNFKIEASESESAVTWDMEGMQYGCKFLEPPHRAFANLLNVMEEDNFVSFAIYTIAIQMSGLQDGA